MSPTSAWPSGNTAACCAPAAGCCSWRSAGRRGDWAQAALKAYLGRVVPALCRWTAPRRRAGQLMDYYWDTIEACVPAETILRHLRVGGLRRGPLRHRARRVQGLFRPPADARRRALTPPCAPLRRRGRKAGTPPPPAAPSSPALATAVAARYAGASRFARGFVAGKLRHDPATLALLRLAAQRPFGDVLDLGCGRGQLGLALLAAGLATGLTGLDRDGDKLAEATAGGGGPARALRRSGPGRPRCSPCPTATRC